MTLANQDLVAYQRGYAAGRALGRKNALAESRGPYELLMRLGAAIEASSQEKIVGLTECERAVVEFYRSALKDES